MRAIRLGLASMNETKAKILVVDDDLRLRQLLERFGGGIAQEIDAASMTLYLKYQHYQGELEGAALNPAVADLEDADFVSFGGLINF